MAKQAIKLKAKGKKVLEEFAKGKLRTPSGKKVTSKERALAIAFSEQRRANKKRRK